MAKRKPQYNYTVLVTYTDGTTSEFYEIAENRGKALDAARDEMDDRVIDYVKSMCVTNREAVEA